jgi:hypothetical protein
MKSMFLILLVFGLSFSPVSCLGKKPKHKPNKPTWQKISKQDQEYPEELETELDIQDIQQDQHVITYHPNPVILAGVGQIMNGALSIAQDPHNRPNLGHSIANMIHGILSIIIEKIAHKRNIDITDQQALMECCNEMYSDISKEITEIIIAKSFLIKEN